MGMEAKISTTLINKNKTAKFNRVSWTDTRKRNAVLLTFG